VDIADLNLSVRAYNAVCRAGIKTIPELYEKYQLDLAQLSREIGTNHTKEVGDALALHREAVWDELEKEDEKFRKLKAGDYLCDYDPEIWGDDLTFDELTQMVGKLVIVNDSWYPDTDTLEEDGEGDVLLVVDADGDVVHLRGDTPKIHEIMRQDMEDRIKIRYCTKVWRIKESEEITNMIQKGNTLSIENSCFISMRTDLDAMLQSTIDKMISKQSDEATITLKIGISLVDAVIGQPVKKPTITHKVTSAITTKESVDGYVAGDYSLYFDDDEGLYAMRELPPDGGQLPLL
jgi:hypothetical protein